MMGKSKTPYLLLRRITETPQVLKQKPLGEGEREIRRAEEKGVHHLH